jgi:hypothetical protein
MSFTPFKSVNINNPGTATAYGSDDLNEIMRILNGEIVSNRQVKIKNPWVWQDNFDFLAASVTPGNPAANSKRFYVEPSNNHFIMKSSSGGTIDFDILGAGSVGEANTTSNAGTGGVGIVLAKNVLDLPFKSINAGSSKITVTDDTTNKNIDIDVAEGNLTHNNIGGILGVTKGGTGLNSLTSQALLKGNGTGNVSLITTGTDGHVLTMVSGAPAWASASAGADTKVTVFENAVQVGSVARRINFSQVDDFAITENSGSDRFDVQLVRSEVLVATWSNFGASSTSTTVNSGLSAFVNSNVGTTYADWISNNGASTDVDGNGKNNFRLYVTWDKNGGSGTHSCRIISQTTSDVLAEIASCVTGSNATTGSLSSYFADNVRGVKVQIKSTVSTDDPIVKSVSLYYK